MSGYIFCTECGNQCESTYKFCNLCGNSLIKADKEVENIIDEKTISQKCEIDVQRILQDSNYNKIVAIKKYRDLTGAGLKESKDIIDEASKYVTTNTSIFKSMQTINTAKLRYYGFHPYYPKECNLNLKIESGNLILSATFGSKVFIPLSEIRNARIENERNTTEGDIVTKKSFFGASAISIKSNSISEKKYLFIECVDSTLKLEGESNMARKFCRSLYDAINRHR